MVNRVDGNGLIGQNLVSQLGLVDDIEGDEIRVVCPTRDQLCLDHRLGAVVGVPIAGGKVRLADHNRTLNARKKERTKREQGESGALHRGCTAPCRP